MSVRPKSDAVKSVTLFSIPRAARQSKNAFTAASTSGSISAWSLDHAVMVIPAAVLDEERLPGMTESRMAGDRLGDHFELRCRVGVRKGHARGQRHGRGGGVEERVCVHCAAPFLREGLGEQVLVIKRELAIHSSGADRDRAAFVSVSRIVAIE